MIKKFKHKGIKKLFETGNTAGIQSGFAGKLRRIPALPETADSADDMDLPGLRLHQLKGNQKERWSVTVTGNWRITFRCSNANVTDVNYEDYH